MSRINNLAYTVCAVLCLILTQPLNAVEPVFPYVADSMYRYSAFYSATMSGTSISTTIQGPIGGSKRIFMEAVTIESSAACTFNVEMYASNASSTLIVPTPLNSSLAAQAQAFGPSNVGSGTVITQVVLAAADVRTIGLAGIVIGSGGATGRNISVVPQCTTGTVKYTWKFAHQRTL